MRGYDLVEHHLARQPAVHRLGRVEPSGLEQLAGRRSTTAPAEVLATVFARLYALQNFAADLPEQRRVFDVAKPLRSDVAEPELAEAGMARTQELGRECRDGAVMADGQYRKRLIPAHPWPACPIAEAWAVLSSSAHS